jgi:hypothetical protein
MRALKVAVVVMGLVIVIGTGVLVAVIVKRVTQAHGGGQVARTEPVRVPPVLAGAAAASGGAVLDEPAGTHIVAIAGYAEGLAVTLAGGGPDRVVLLDRDLRVVGRIGLAR